MDPTMFISIFCHLLENPSTCIFSTFHCHPQHLCNIQKLTNDSYNPRNSGDLKRHNDITITLIIRTKFSIAFVYSPATWCFLYSGRALLL